MNENHYEGHELYEQSLHTQHIHGPIYISLDCTQYDIAMEIIIRNIV